MFRQGASPIFFPVMNGLVVQSREIIWTNAKLSRQLGLPEQTSVQLEWKYINSLSKKSHEKYQQHNVRYFIQTTYDGDTQAMHNVESQRATSLFFFTITQDYNYMLHWILIFWR